MGEMNEIVPTLTLPHKSSAIFIGVQRIIGDFIWPCSSVSFNKNWPLKESYLLSKDITAGDRPSLTVLHSQHRQGLSRPCTVS